MPIKKLLRQNIRELHSRLRAIKETSRLILHPEDQAKLEAEVVSLHKQINLLLHQLADLVK